MEIFLFSHLAMLLSFAAVLNVSAQRRKLAQERERLQHLKLLIARGRR